MGCAAVTLSGVWSVDIIKEALREPVKITLAVLAAGMLFLYAKNAITRHVSRIMNRTGLKLFIFMTTVSLGLLSSVITAIVAALVLAEIVGHIKLDKKSEIRFVVIACFSIGLGAVLTPFGEPLAAIASGKLKGEPYHAGLFFLFNNLWYFIIPAIILMGILAAAVTKNNTESSRGLRENREENIKDVLIRSAKIYIFVMALVLLGGGFKPLVDVYISKIPSWGIYWINSVSAVLDNATLAAAEIGPSMSMEQIVSALLGLIIAGGMLIPGNIPNIIAAGKLNIKSSEWAKTGLPLGLAMMAVCFIVLQLLNIR
jgi:predicted cation transporter